MRASARARPIMRAQRIQVAAKPAIVEPARTRADKATSKQMSLGGKRVLRNELGPEDGPNERSGEKWRAGRFSHTRARHESGQLLRVRSN